MKTRLLLSLACFAGLCVSSASAQPSLDPRTLTADLPFAMAPVALPQIPARVCSIADHGARGDGATLNTEAIAAAIEACSKAGGGRVVVPRGIFLTGPIELKSRIDLHLDRGALLRFSPRFELYPPVRASYEGGDRVKARSPIWAKGAEDIAITGEGVIDGSGQAWRPVKKFKMTANQWKALLASGGVVDASGENWWPSREAMNGEATVKALDARGSGVPLADYAAAREFLRPVMISLVECRRVLLDGPTFQNSPAWNIHPLLCEDMVIRNITVLNPWYSQNGDGLDLESCRRVIVHNCKFDVGDDAICIKSGKDEAGRKRGRPTEDIVIADNIVYHGHGGFTVGSEMSGGVRNILVERCTFLGTDIGVRFKTTRGRGGVVEKIWIRDVQMTDIPTDAIGFNMYYGGEAPTEAADNAAARSSGDARRRGHAAVPRHRALAHPLPGRRPRSDAGGPARDGDSRDRARGRADDRAQGPDGDRRRRHHAAPRPDRRRVGPGNLGAHEHQRHRGWRSVRRSGAEVESGGRRMNVWPLTEPGSGSKRLSLE